MSASDDSSENNKNIQKSIDNHLEDSKINLALSEVEPGDIDRDHRSHSSHRSHWSHGSHRSHYSSW